MSLKRFAWALSGASWGLMLSGHKLEAAVTSLVAMAVFVSHYIIQWDFKP